MVSAARVYSVPKKVLSGKEGVVGRLGGWGAHFLCVDDDGALKVMERFFVADVEQNNIWQAEKTKLR